MADVSSKPPTINEREYYTAMSHFYRGEISRIMIWRQRLDTTSNWAVVTSTGVITFALGHPEITHFVFMIGNVLVFLLLIIEGRRYRYYDAFSARVRMLEAHFLVPVVMRSTGMLEGDWRRMLAEDLILPEFKIGVRESVSYRLKQNYIWILGVMQFAWATKVCLHSGPIHSLGDFLRALQSQQILAPWIFWILLIGFYSMLIALVFYSPRNRRVSGEMNRRSRPHWNI